MSTPIPMEPAELLLSEWYALEQQHAALKNAERDARRAAAAANFPGAAIGNHVKMLTGGAYLCAAKFGLNYTVDAAHLYAAIQAGTLENVGVRVGTLFRWTPHLNLGAYNALTHEQRAEVDKVLNISEALPVLEIKPVDPAKVAHEAAQAAAGEAPATDQVAQPAPAGEAITGGSSDQAPPPVESAPAAAAVPAPAPAPAPASAAPVMTAKAGGASYESFVERGWTDAQMIEHGYMEKPKRTRKPRAAKA